MPDITICSGKTEVAECPLRDICYRFTVTPDPLWQSQFVNIPYNWDKKDCEHFLKVWGQTD